jgi:Reverse transcriptase (RNA-dependent DNA polymerase)
MAVRLNDQLILWCVAVLQPASADDVLAYMSILLPETKGSVDSNSIEGAIELLIQKRLLLRVHKTAGLCSITASANRRLPKALQVTRDSARLFLMHSMHGGRLRQSGEPTTQELDGDAPPIHERSDVEGAARPINTAGHPRITWLPGRVYRPRTIQQLGFSVGSDGGSPDSSLKYDSFASVRQIHEAADDSTDATGLSLEELALCIGVSLALLKTIILRKHKHYRTFSIAKRSGGQRPIESPRVYLKTIQRWLADFILAGLPVHDACHSYRVGRSIVSNSQKHIGQAYVACMDIENFFGSISKRDVSMCLQAAGLWAELSENISNLCTFRGRLPQGAPTSPVISNAYLFNFDREVTAFTAHRGALYTRYADDLTISGETKESVSDCITYASKQLEEHGLRVNRAKTRVISRQGQQRVTGVVVNEVGIPSRKYRRQVRAQFHNARLKGEVGREELNRLRGLVSYLRQFPTLRQSQSTRQLIDILGELRIRNGRAAGR